MQEVKPHVKARRDRMKLAAVDYSRAMRSDPFALNRCMTHINMGICDPDPKGRDMHYTAEEYYETRKLPPTEEFPDGEEYKAVAYKNVVSV